MDLMKMSCKHGSWISLSCVMRIDHRSHELPLGGLIIDFMKLSYEDWSLIPWSCGIRVDHGYHEVEW